MITGSSHKHYCFLKKLFHINVCIILDLPIFRVRNQIFLANIEIWPVNVNIDINIKRQNETVNVNDNK